MDPFLAGLDALRDDEHLRRRARAAMARPVGERLAEAAALCRMAAEITARLPPDVQARARAYRAAPGPGAEALLARFLAGDGGR